MAVTQIQHYSSFNILYAKDPKGVIYYQDPELGPRLCIPDSEIKTVFQLAHDDLGHTGYNRLHKRISNGLFINRMGKQLRSYLNELKKKHEATETRVKELEALDAIELKKNNRALPQTVAKYRELPVGKPWQQP